MYFLGEYNLIDKIIFCVMQSNEYISLLIHNKGVIISLVLFKSKNKWYSLDMTYLFQDCRVFGVIFYVFKYCNYKNFQKFIFLLF